MKYRFDAGQTYGQPIWETADKVSELSKDDRDLFEKMFADPDWGVLDFDAGNLVVEFWAENRIVSLQRQNGHELLRTPKLGTLDIIYSLPMQLSRLDSRWRLIG